MGVRQESVRLTLDDDFTSKMARAAAATKLLGGALDSLDGKSVRATQSTTKTTAAVEDQGSAFRKSGADIDKFSGRLRILADAAAILGPSLVPIGAVAIPAVTGLASQLGFAALGAGTLAVAFNGVGDAVSAVNAYALEPTTANLEKAQAAMKGLAPEAQNFVLRLRDMMPALTDLRNATASGLFPGVTASLDDLEAVLPRIESIFVAVAKSAGSFAQETAESFNSDRWTPFFDYLATEAPSALTTLGRTVGSLTHGLAELWMAFTPLNRDFAGWMLDVSRSFDGWAQGLSQTDGFREFIDYIETNGPRVADSLGALGGAVLQIVEALAPLGGPSLQIIETFADVIGAVADSDLGTPILTGVAALALYNRALGVTLALQKGFFAGTVANTKAAGAMFGASGFTQAGKAASAAIPTMRQFGSAMAFAAYSGDTLNKSAASSSASVSTSAKNALAARGAVRAFGSSLAASAGQAGRFLGPMAGLALATSDAGESFALTNTAAGAMIGMMGGPWGVALGGAAGYALDLARASEDLGAALEKADRAMQSGSTSKISQSYQDIVSRGAELEQQINGLGNLDFNFGDDFAAASAIITGRAGDTGRALDDLNGDLQTINSGGVVGAEALRSLLDPTSALGAAMKVAADSTDEFAASFARLNGLLSARDGLLNYNDSLKALRQSINDNGQAWDTMSDKGMANNRALNSMASNVEAYANTLKEAGRNAEAADFLKGAIQQFREIGSQSAGAAKKVQPIIAALKEAGGIKAKPKIDLETGAFEKKAAGAKKRVTELDRAKATALGEPERWPAARSGTGCGQEHGRARSSASDADREPERQPDPVEDAGRDGSAERAGLLHRQPDREPDRPASAGISRIIGGLAGIHSKTVTITTVFRAGWPRGVATPSGWPMVVTSLARVVRVTT